ncbi:Glutaredoxin [Balamuthia mandrillaris]
MGDVPELPMAHVELYSTSATSLLKTKKAIQSIRYLLDAKRINFEEYDVSMDAMRREEMQDKSGDSALPQLFINGKYVGGWEEVEMLNEQGTLDELLLTPPEFMT